MVERTEADWHAREQELLNRIANLENEQQSIIEEYEKKYDSLTATLTKSKEEIVGLMKKLANMEKDLTHKQMLSSDAQDKGGELLNKAKTLLFEQTKVSKNQEMQIAALNTQVVSLKEVLTVTREMLEIRNTEIEHMKIRMESAEVRLKTERDLMERRFNISEKMFKHLKDEHDVQTALFKELKGSYLQKIDILKQELTKEREAAVVQK